MKTSLRGPTEWAGMWAPCLVKYIRLCTIQVEDILLATKSRVYEIICPLKGLVMSYKHMNLSFLLIYTETK